jgi:hypothetical protein
MKSENNSTWGLLKAVHRTSTGGYKRATAYVKTSTGVRVTSYDVGRERWIPGEPLPERQPDAVLALFRAGEAHGRHVAEEGRGRRAA